MMQAPPDPEVIVPVFGMLTGIVITGFVVLGPIGRTIADVIRHIFGIRRRDEGLAAGEADELRRRLDDLQHQVGELAERQDFSERLLAQARERGALPGAGPGT